MNPFSYIFVLIILTTFLLKKNTRFYNFVILELVFSVSRINVGYFMKIGPLELQYDDVLLGILSFLSTSIVLKNLSKINIKLLTFSLFLVLAIIIGMLLLILNPSDAGVIYLNNSWDYYFRGITQLDKPEFSFQSILLLIRVIIFLLILLAMSIKFNKEIYLKSFKTIFKISRVILIYYGFFELFLKRIFSFDPTFVTNVFFGRGISTSSSLDRLSCLSREPSYYSFGLYIFILLCYFLREVDFNFNRRQYNVSIFLAIVLGLSSFSFSIILILGSILLIHFTFSNKLKVDVLFFITLILCTALFFIFSIDKNSVNSENLYIYRALNSILQFKNGITGEYKIGEDFSSETVRIIGAIITFKSFLTRPFFGLGIGTAFTSSGIVSILSNVGLIGIVLWSKVVFKYYTKNNKKLFFLSLLVLLPATFVYDLSIMYDTSYLILIPLIRIAYLKRNKI